MEGLVAGGRFGDSLCVDCANLLYVGGRNQLTNTKFTRPNLQISKSSYHNLLLRVTLPSGSTLAYAFGLGRSCALTSTELRKKVSGVQMRSSMSL